MRILLIDDTPLSITLLQHVIKKIPEYESVAFTDPVEALDWCRDNEPDLVIVDYTMPEMNGIQFTQQFRGFVNYDSVPVLMVTTSDEISIRHKALAGGVTDFLIKPIDNSELIARARNLLTIRQAQKYLADRSYWLNDELNKATARMRLQEKEMMLSLAISAEYLIPDTSGHVQRVGLYAKHIAEIMGLSVDLQKLVYEAAPMHDIGKAGIPDDICLKTTELTSEEFELMKTHTEIGYEFMHDSSSPVLQAAAEIAYCHHEKYDGTGYPRGLQGNDIPLLSRIVTVADVFDALTTERPYRPAWSIDDASQYLRDEMGKQFDPQCVSAFFCEFEEVLMIKNTRSLRLNFRQF